MKTINYFSGSLLALLFYALFAACNNDLQTIAVTEIKGIEQTLLNESNSSLNKNMKRGWIGGKIEKVRYLLYMNIRYPVVIFLLDMVLILAYII